MDILGISMNGAPVDMNDQSIIDQIMKLLGESRIREFDEATDKIARKQLNSALIALLFNGMSFYGTLLMEFNLVNGDTWLETMAVTYPNTGRGKPTICYNTKFVEDLGDQGRIFVLGHELMHVIYDTFDRQGHRDHKKFNVAADYEINAELIRQNIGKFPAHIGGCYDPKYDKMTAEAIYDLLPENPSGNTLDIHIGNGGGASDSAGGSPMSSDLKRELRQKIINAAKMAQGNGDRIPGSVSGMLENLSNPVMPWRDLIQTQLSSMAGGDYSWLKPNRACQHMDAILPGIAPDEEIDVHFMIDQSGSCWSPQVLHDFFSEIKGVVEMYRGFRIHLACFDTVVKNPVQLSSDDASDMMSYVPEGGGGTDFTAIFEYLKDQDMVPKRLFVLTDMEPYGSWGDPDYCPTTWIGYGTTSIKPPFGDYAYYDEFKK